MPRTKTTCHRDRAIRGAHVLVLLVIVTIVTGCEPNARRPGQWLRGEVTSPPTDWSFTDEHPEIFVEVQTPYFIPHSVTIWCAQVDGDLYIGARDPDTKNWPGWMAANNNVRLKIGESVYAVRAADVTDAATLEHVKAAYRKKYALEATSPTVRYWLIESRT